MSLKWRCTLCGLCCKRFTPFVLPTDVYRIQRARARPLHTFLTFYRASDFEVALEASDQPYFFRSRHGPVVMCLSRVELPQGEAGCVFLEDNGCSIYPFRPMVCRQYPFQPQEDGNGAGPFRVMDAPCFGKHVEDEIVDERPVRENYLAFHAEQDEFLQRIEAWNGHPRANTRGIIDALSFFGMEWR